MADGDSDPVRKDIQVLRETIDRNRDLDWEDYRETHEFRLVSDGVVRVRQPDEENEGAYEVELDESGAVDCSCFVVTRPFGTKSCRHMRAVDAHPQL